jgi:hypothetical protein
VKRNNGDVFKVDDAIAVDVAWNRYFNCAVREVESGWGNRKQIIEGKIQ